MANCATPAIHVWCFDVYYSVEHVLHNHVHATMYYPCIFTHVIHVYDIHMYYTCSSVHVIHDCVGYAPVVYVGLFI